MSRASPSPDRRPSETHSLVARYQAGDRAALEQLCTRYQGRIRRMACIRMGAFLRAREDVDDAVQDVFVRLIEGIERFQQRDDARFINWVARLVQHELANHRRHGRADKRGAGKLPGNIHGDGGTNADLEIAADTRGVASRVADHELSEHLDACIATLPEAHREVVLLREYAGCDWKAVAEEMGRSVEACQQLHRRARAELARRMTPRQQEGDSGA